MKYGIRLCEVIALLGISFAVAACEDPAVLVGKVEDNFGNPLSDVRVSVANSELSTTTDESGSYALKYVPGSFRLEFSKETHIGDVVDLNLQSKEEYPLSTRVLTQRPPPDTIVLVGNDGYIPLVREYVGADNNAGAMVSNALYFTTLSEYSDVTLNKFNAAGELTLELLDATDAKFTAVKAKGSLLGRVQINPMQRKSDIETFAHTEKDGEDLTFRTVTVTAKDVQLGARYCFVRFTKNVYGDQLLSSGADRAYCINFRPTAICVKQEPYTVDLDAATEFIHLIIQERLGKAEIGYDVVQKEHGYIHLRFEDEDATSVALAEMAAFIIGKTLGIPTYYVVDEVRSLSLQFKLIDNRTLPDIC